MNESIIKNTMKEITPNARGIYAIQVNLKIDKIKLIIALAKRIITNIFLYSGSLVKGIVVLHDVVNCFH